MSRYEFRLVHRQCGADLGPMLEEMNALGQDGWYCVTQWVDRGWDYVLMQREIINPPAPQPRPHVLGPLGDCVICGTKKIDEDVVRGCPGLGGIGKLGEPFHLGGEPFDRESVQREVGGKTE